MIILIAAASFTGCFLIVYFVLSRPSAQGARLEQVAREARGTTAATTWLSHVSADQVAKPFTFFYRLFGSKPTQDLTRRLSLAGYRKPAHSDIFLGSRLALPALLGVLVAALLQDNTFLFFIVALVIGFFIPDFWLSHAINKRREQIARSLPDGLDLLSICIEAGLGMDQAVVRVAQELRVSHPQLSEELLLVNLEQRAGSPRLDAWRGFADRAGVESARSFVAMLIQTDRFGTPISKSLSTFSDALRTQRRQRAEEQASKTTIKLVFPLVLFIFPSIFIVTVGPAVLTVMRNIGHLAG